MVGWSQRGCEKIGNQKERPGDNSPEIMPPTKNTPGHNPPTLVY